MTPSSRWLQKMQTQHLNERILSSGPIVIAYGPLSGNVIAAAGIMGVIVGTPNGEWTAVAVGEYSPADFSRIARLKTLLLHNIFWATVVTFPFLMIALAFSFKDLMIALTFSSKDLTQRGFLLRENLKYGGSGNTIAGFSRGLRSQLKSYVANYYIRRSRSYHFQTEVYEDLRVDAMSALSVLFLFVSLFSVAFMWVLGSGAKSGGWIWLPVAILVGASVLASVTAWRGRWKVHLGGLAGTCLAMGAFVALPFLVWVQTGLPLAAPKTLAVVLCIATAAAISMRLKSETSLPPGPGQAGSES